MTEYCAYRKCNLVVAPGAPKQRIDTMRVMHRHCYQEHLNALSERAERRESCVRVQSTSRSRWFRRTA